MIVILCCQLGSLADDRVINAGTSTGPLWTSSDSCSHSHRWLCWLFAGFLALLPASPGGSVFSQLWARWQWTPAHPQCCSERSRRQEVRCSSRLSRLPGTAGLDAEEKRTDSIHKTACLMSHGPRYTRISSQLLQAMAA
jgi:hypothetical protein